MSGLPAPGIIDANAVSNKLSAHLADSADRHKASNISIADAAGNFTTEDVEGALAELFQDVGNGKILIASAITDMGQAASGSDTFDTLATKIRDISDDANATVADVLSGKTFYQGGVKRTGTMSNRGAGGTVTPGTANIIKSAGYYSSDITIQGDADLISSNILNNKTIFNVTGNVVPGPPNGLKYIMRPMFGLVQGYHDLDTVNITWNIDYVRLGGNRGTVQDKQLAIVTSDPVDLTYINSILIDWENPDMGMGTRSFLIASTNQMGGYSTYNAVVSINGNFALTTTTLDVSGLTGSFYIRAHSRTDSSTSLPPLTIRGLRAA